MSTTGLPRDQLLVDRHLALPYHLWSPLLRRINSGINSFLDLAKLASLQETADSKDLFINELVRRLEHVAVPPLVS